MGTIPQLCRAIRTLGDLNVPNQRIFWGPRVKFGGARGGYNIVNFGPLAAEIVSLVLGSLTAQPYCGVEQRAPPVFDRAAITLGIGPHFYFLLFSFLA